MENDMELRFSGKDSPFSNFYPAKAMFEGSTYANSEAAFQAAKTLDLHKRRAFFNMDPGTARREGRRLNLRADWEDIKYQVMVDVLYSKFKNERLGKLLLETGDKVIVEDTTRWHDNAWGDCRCEKCKDIKGRNLLGKALMEVRGMLKGEVEKGVAW